MKKSKYTFVIIGSGIIGLTLAKELYKKHKNAKILILEKEKSIGLHASGRNSGVVHSGIYYPSGSLKAEVAVEGARKLKKFAKDNNLPIRESGKIIIGKSIKDAGSIETLINNANNSGIKYTPLDRSKILKLEPYAKGNDIGIHIPFTSVVDSKSLIQCLYSELINKSITFSFDSKILKFEEQTIILDNQIIQYEHLFNAAGFGSLEIAHKFNLAKNYALLPFKGIYYKLKKDRDFMVNNNIYPVPDLNYPFLGVHLTRLINDDVFVGPTAIPVFGPENYSKLKGIDLRFLKDIIFIHSQMLIKNKNNFRSLFKKEFQMYFKKNFVETARSLVPAINEKDLVSSNKVGIRPQIVNSENFSLEMDFIIEKTDSSTHILNSISPAFTTSLGFAEYVVSDVNY